MGWGGVGRDARGRKKKGGGESTRRRVFSLPARTPTACPLPSHTPHPHHCRRQVVQDLKTARVGVGVGGEGEGGVGRGGKKRTNGGGIAGRALSPLALIALPHARSRALSLSLSQLSRLTLCPRHSVSKPAPSAATACTPHAWALPSRPKQELAACVPPRCARGRGRERRRPSCPMRPRAGSMFTPPLRHRLPYTARARGAQSGQACVSGRGGRAGGRQCAWSPRPLTLSKNNKKCVCVGCPQFAILGFALPSALPPRRQAGPARRPAS